VVHVTDIRLASQIEQGLRAPLLVVVVRALAGSPARAPCASAAAD
jgi:hypothetical protein